MLDRSGALNAYAKTELIDGGVYHMDAQHRPHARIKSRLYRLLADALDQQDGTLEAMVEASVAMLPNNVPEPDLVVTDAAEGDGLVPLTSVKLIVEVSDTSLITAMGSKASVYARHRVPEYWVVDLNGRVIHQMWAPEGEAYTEQRQLAFGERIAAATVPGLRVETSGL